MHDNKQNPKAVALFLDGYVKTHNNKDGVLVVELCTKRGGGVNCFLNVLTFFVGLKLSFLNIICKM